MPVRLRLNPVVPAVWLGLGLGAGSPALAQTTRPGEVLAPPTRTEAPAPAAVPAVERSQAPAVPAGGTEGATVTVRRFEFAGNTVFDSASLQALVASYLNRPLSLLDIYEAADRVAGHYVEHGYTLASVNVPPQKVADGSVRMLISEGRIARLTTEGETSYSTAQLAPYFPKVRRGTVYQAGALDRGLRTLNTLPGLKARAVIKPGEVYGTSDVVIRVEDDRVDGLASVDNYGRESIGEMRYLGLVRINNPLHAEDQLQLLALTSEDGLLNYGYAAYSLPLAYRGTRLSFSYGHADFEVANTPVDGRNRTGRIAVDHPLVRSARESLSASFGASRSLSNADFGGATFTETEITLAELGLSYNRTSENLAVTQVSTSIASNFDEATRAELSQASGVIDADQRLRWELDFQHLQPLANIFQLFVHLNGVYSPDPLSPTQQYSLGGPTTIRGYAPAEVRGDRGYFGSVDLRKPFVVGDLRMSARLFADSGRVYIVDAAPGSGDAETLTSVGVGFDAAYSRMALKLDWAMPTDNHPSSDGRDDGRLYGSFTVHF